MAKYKSTYTMNVAVSISQASGSAFKPNKHGKLPLILNALNGFLPPNSGVVDATILERLGLSSGQQAVLNISPREDYVDSSGRVYKNYNYVLVTRLGQGFENMVAQQVVSSMDFGFIKAVPVVATPTPTPVVVEETPTPVVATVVEETPETT
jgi:hypothetical protein